MKRAWHFLRTMNGEAALDSARTVLAVIGAGARFYVFPALCILALVWRIDYERHDLPAQTALEQAGAVQS